MDIIDLSNNTLDEIRSLVDESNKYVLIDFYAFWCEPCVMLNPVIQELAQNYREDMNVYKVDVDKNPDIADEYNITNVPTLVLHQKGNILTNMVGYNSYDRLDKTIKDIVNK